MRKGATANPTTLSMTRPLDGYDIHDPKFLKRKAASHLMAQHPLLETKALE